MFFQPSSANLTQPETFHQMNRRRLHEDAAIRALENGLAFEEGTREDRPNWQQNPHFDEALQAFADLDSE